MIVLLSPAKTLDFESPVVTDRYTQPRLLDDAADLVSTMASFSPDEIGSLMDISGDVAALNAERFAQWRQSSHDAPGPSRQAVLAFRGEVYRGLAAHEMDDEDLAFAQEHLRILSGLYGVLRPLDLMLPYRLEMGRRVANPRGANLYDYWRSAIADVLAQDIRGPRDVVVNLASQEYFRAVDTEELGVPVVTPLFKERRQSGLRTIGVYAKRARGVMARYIIEHRLTKPDGLRGFREDGYAIDPALSDERRWVFVR